jgi:hypothetical protein
MKSPDHVRLSLLNNQEVTTGPGQNEKFHFPYGLKFPNIFSFALS